jgi:hypothetical protein
MLKSVPRCLLTCLLLSCAGDEEEPATEVESGPQILFGDLHVHSTNSVDAYVLKVPLFGGHGAVGPAAHCDFARYCSQLDFWAITDHQEFAPPSAWAESRDAVEVCNDLYGGNSDDPDMVSFAGFEWQQSATEPAEDWGHKNVIFRTGDRDALPTHAIASVGQVISLTSDQIDLAVGLAALADPEHADIYDDVGAVALEGFTAETCPDDVPSTELPETCVEYAADPATLYDKLDQWGEDALVIPHGFTWSAHHPYDVSWRHQLNATQHSPKYQTLVEINSGHGSMEEYRSWRHSEWDGDLQICPEPTPDFLPCCARAGQLAELASPECDADPEGTECLDIVFAAEQAFLAAGRDGHDTIGGAESEDWLDCDECRDCFQPALGHRPLGTAQAGLAMSAFEEDGTPIRYQFGFIGSTDTHAVGPGTGYKELRQMADIHGPAKPEFEPLVQTMMSEMFPDWQRQNSYYYSGGLVAVHAQGRSRDDIWDALDKRQVYATTGERMLLWFDLLNPPTDESVAMGGSATLTETPRFEVRAVGSNKQLPGCPDAVERAAPDGLIENSCFGECYNPTDERYVIQRIEVVRITPQASVDEPLEPLISDPFLVLDCPGDPEGCTVQFEDPDFVAGDREAMYYVRAIQESTLTVNAENLRCETDETGACIETNPCVGGFAGDGDPCTDSNQERAWASPIYLTPG